MVFQENVGVASGKPNRQSVVYLELMFEYNYSTTNLTKFHFLSSNSFHSSGRKKCDRGPQRLHVGLMNQQLKTQAFGFLLFVH